MASKFILAALAVVALGLPVQASAKSDNSGQGNAKGRNVVADGTVTSVDATGGVVTVSIEHGNRAADDVKGQSVDFNVSESHLQTGDANDDGSADLQDVTVGDKAQVQWRASSDATPPFTAKRFKDRTTLDDESGD
jgi:hypothetical protein